MNKFSYLDYTRLVKDLLQDFDIQGRGQQSRLARHMQVHTTFLSHVFNGKSHLSPEQALRVASFFSFTSLETDYFLNLVQFNRAGDAQTRSYFEVKLQESRGKGFTLKEQLKKETHLSAETQAMFYSDWTYSAVRLATALPDGGRVERIAKMLGLPPDRVAKIVDFLVATGLCKIKDDRLTYGPFSTFVDASSPFAKKLHDNWRLRSIQSGVGDGEDLMYSSAVTLTKADFLRLRDVLLAMLKNFEKITDESDPKMLAYITLDWIKLI